MSKFKYQELIKHLEADIFPELSPGDMLPLDKELCEKYKVSSITVKKAMNILAKDGRVRRIPGKGTVLNKIGKKSYFAANNNTEITIKVLTVNDWDTGDLLEKLCGDFQRNNSNVKFEFHRVGDMYYEECELDNYDLILGNTWMIREYLTNSDYKENILPLAELPNLYIDKSIYFENVIKWSSVEDELYCLPLGVSPVFAMYNLDSPGLQGKEWDFDAYKSFDEFRDFLYGLNMPETSKGNFYPLLLSLEYNRWPCFFKMHGGRIFDASGKHCILNSQSNAVIFEDIQKLLDDKVISPSIFDLKGLCSDLFYAGRGACMLGTYKYLRKSFEGGYNIKYGMLPNSKQNLCSHLLIEGILVTQSCKDPSLIAELLNFLQTSKNQLEICRNSDGFSAQKDLAELYLRNLSVKEPSIMNILEQVEYSEPTATEANVKKWRKLFEMLPKIWMGIDSVENICNEITNAVNNIS